MVIGKNLCMSFYIFSKGKILKERHYHAYSTRVVMELLARKSERRSQIYVIEKKENYEWVGLEPASSGPHIGQHLSEEELN